MDDIVKKFVIKYQIIEHYYDSTKYKKYVELNPTSFYDCKDYKNVNLTDAIQSYPYVIFEIDSKNKNGINEYYDFKVIYHPKLDIFINTLIIAILSKKPDNMTLEEFISNFESSILTDYSNWNVYASK